MNIEEIRDELHQFINHADERILNLMYGMMNVDTGNDQALEKSIDVALDQSKNGITRPHHEVMGELRARFKV